MKISNLKRAMDLKNKRDNMQCLLDADGFAYINDGHREYNLPNDPRLKRAICEAIAGYMYELKCDLIQLGVEVDE